MKRLRWLPALLAVLLLVVGSIGIWAAKHQSYPNAVEYYRGTIAAPNHTPQRVEYWFDAKRDLQVVRVPAPNSRAIRYLTQFLPEGGPPAILCGSSATPQCTPGTILASGMFGLALQGLVQAIERQGSVVGYTLPTGVPHGMVIVMPYDTPETEAFTRPRPMAPGTLPADFFDPTQQYPSLWDRFTGWLRDQLRP